MQGMADPPERREWALSGPAQTESASCRPGTVTHEHKPVTAEQCTVLAGGSPVPAVCGSRQKPGTDRTEQLPLRRQARRGPSFQASLPRACSLGKPRLRPRRQPRTRASSAFWLAAPAPPHSLSSRASLASCVPPALRSVTADIHDALSPVTTPARRPAHVRREHCASRPLWPHSRPRCPPALRPTPRPRPWKAWPLQPHIRCAPQWQSDGRGQENWALTPCA